MEDKTSSFGLKCNMFGEELHVPMQFNKLTCPPLKN